MGSWNKYIIIENERYKIIISNYKNKYGIMLDNKFSIIVFSKRLVKTIILEKTTTINFFKNENKLNEMILKIEKELEG